MKLKLTNKKIKDKGLATIILKDDTLWGRSQAADVVIPDSRVSRLHIQIILKKKSLVLRCLSVKGIRINDELLRMDQEVKIQNQDKIKFANSEELQWTLQTSSSHSQSNKEVKIKEKRREAVIGNIEKTLQQIQVVKSNIEWNTKQIRDSLVDTNMQRDALKEELKKCKKEMQMVREHLSCAICLDIMRNPVILAACGHSLCNDCLQTWKKEKTSCPICRTRFTEIIINPNLVKMSQQMLPVVTID